ncbi:MAG: hypothetical protein IJ232_11375, partial [Lachnospiraceae bacterium]|nr:hypothetical protein [Lachnospiraceae bacterium]
MRVMLLEWLGHMQQDLEDVMRRIKNLSFRVFFYPFPSTSEAQDEYFRKHFESALLRNHYDAVISFNFIPVAAMTCNKIGLPYIAWVYDSGLGYRISRNV